MACAGGQLDPAVAALFTRGTADAGTGAGAAGHLALWHGLTPALGLTAVTFALGLAMFYARGLVDQAQSAVPGWI